MIQLTILGSTGSIGANTLEVVSLHPERFCVFALTANSNVEKMLAQCLIHQPRYAVMRDIAAAECLERELRGTGSVTEVLGGNEALIWVASHPQVDAVMAAIVGAVGLAPTLAAAQAGKRVLLANKEALVLAGSLLMQAVHDHQAVLLPVDSEHNAIFQCLPSGYRPGSTCPEVTRIILTASGGAFRDWPLAQLADATPEQACQHPNWVMGRKITVDSATMFNKGLELIEAKWLFNMPISGLEVVLHPQSIVHSFVAYHDGSLLAQLGLPDMRVPIAYALSWPERIVSGVEQLDLLSVGRLDFVPLDLQRYPCFGLACEALRLGGTATVVVNAANEVAVQAFLDRSIRFTDIARVIAQTLEAMTVVPVTHLAQLLEVDALSRDHAKRIVATLKPSVYR